jgi:imidazolonepropionase-like amidohydrolase
MGALAAPIVIHGGRLIDGTGGKPIENATVVIEGNRITRVATGAVEIAKEARRVDATGKTVMPGLIDNHVHYRDLLGELFLAHGVTSVRDLGNPLEWILAQRDAVAQGWVAGPRIFCAGGGFYGRATAEHHVVIDDTAEIRNAARELIALGVDYLKTHLGISPEIARAVAAEGHPIGLKVTGHLDSSIMPYAGAGIDGVEHATGCAEATIRSEEGLRRLAGIKLWLAKFLGPWSLAEREHFAEVTEFLAAKGTFIEPTSVLWGASLGAREKWEKEDYEILKQPGLSYLRENDRLIWLDHHYVAYGAMAPEPPKQDVVIGNRYSIHGILPADRMREGFGRLGEFLSQLVKAGGNVVAGTDAPAVLPGISLHREVEFLVRLGLSPMQAIMAATKVGADYLGKGDVLGTVEEGKLADVVIVNGDPLKDITHTRKVDTVIKNGAIVDTSFHPSFSNPIPRPHGREFYGYPAPQLDDVSPKVASERGREVELILKGKDFYPGSLVAFGDNVLATTFVGQNELRATLPSHLLGVGTIPITVVNPKPHEIPGKGVSNSLAVIVKFASLGEAA